MNSNIPALGPDQPLFEALFSEFVSAGKGIMPSGGRHDVIDLLTRLMIDGELFDAYTVELDTRRARLGAEGELRLLRAPAIEIAGEKILNEGFGGLTDDSLADLATSPEALFALDRVHFRGAGEPGRWFYDAIDRQSGRQPDAARRAIQAGELTRRVKNQNGEMPQASPALSPPHRAKRYRWLSFAIPTALAASLLLNAYLGFGPKRDPEDPRGSTKGKEEQWVASAIVEPATVRGPDNEKLRQLRVRGPAKGFVTLIALSSERKQIVFPDSGVDYIQISAEETSEGVVLPAATTRVVYVVTETPASEPIRLKFSGRESPRYLVAQEADVVQNLTRVLKETGYRRFTIGAESVAPP